MKVGFQTVRHTLWLLAIVAINACGPDMPASGGPNKDPDNIDDWLVFGQVSTKGFSNGEIVAIGMDGVSFRSTIADDQSFGLELPGNSTYAVYFVPARAGDNKPAVSPSEFIDMAAGPRNQKTTACLLTFEESAEIGMRNTLRLPKVIGSNRLDMGQIDCKNQQAFATINPATILDFDNDGLNDFSDLDDQNDGLLDKMQKDMIERVQVCHFNGPDNGSVQNIPLTSLYEHMEHGDIFGACPNGMKKTNGPTNNNSADDAPSMPAPATNPDKNAPRKSGAIIEETPDEEGEAEDKKDDKKPGDKPADDKADDKKDGKDGDDKVGDGKDGDDKAGDEKDGDKKPEDGKPADDKPGEDKGGSDQPENPAPNKPKKPKKGKNPEDKPHSLF